MNEQLFFCFGPPKSGTTFLQRTLDLHPEISCPTEHNFDFLINNIKALLEQYDQLRKLIDTRTGGQETAPLRESIQKKVFSYTVEKMVRESAKGKKIAGANDNAIIEKIELYNTLFNSPKFIAIFRNPVDTAISAWHHNLRLAEEENDPQHKLFMTKHGGLEEWMKVVARTFSNNAQACLNFRRHHDNLIIVRYEDLITHKRENLLQIFNFLGASTDEETLNTIIDKSGFAAMKNNSTKREFFRSGSTDMGKDTVSDALRVEIASIASTTLQALGYDLLN